MNEGLGSTSHGPSSTTTGAAIGLPEYGELEFVESGDIGTVYATVDVVHSRQILVQIGRGPDIERLQRAFEAWRDLGTHPNIVTVFNLHMSDDDSMVALEMERHTESLADRLDAQGALPFVQVLALGHGLMSGLVELHRSGQVHGSISTANIYLSADERPQIANIGFAGIDTPRTAEFESDVQAAAGALAEALGATVSSRRGLAAADRSGPFLAGPAELDDVPRDLRDLIAMTAVGSGVVTAEALRSSLTTLCRRWIGQVPENISAKSQIEAGELHPRHRDSDLTSSGASATRDPEIFGAGEDHTHSGASTATIGDPEVQSDRPPAETSGGAPDPPASAESGTDERVDRWWLKPAAVAGAAACAFVIAFLLVADFSTEPPPPVSASSSPVGNDLDAVSIEAPDTSTGGVATTTPSPDEVIATPDAPSDVEATFTGPGEVQITWKNNSSVVQGFAVRLASFEIGLDGAPVPDPTFDGWVDEVGQKSTTTDLRLLPADASSLTIAIDDFSRLTCLRPVAVAIVATGGGADVETGSPSEEQVCVPGSAPAAPAVTYLQPEVRPAGPNRVEWDDQSLDEGSFRLLFLDPETERVNDFKPAPADAESLSVDLLPGSTTCFVVRAENARNLDRLPLGKLLTDNLPPSPPSNSRPFCFVVP